MLNTLANFITILFDFEKRSGKVVSFARPEFVSQRLICLTEMKVLKMGNYMKVKIFIWQLEKYWSDRWLKNGVGQVLFLMQLFLYCILFSESFIA